MPEPSDRAASFLCPPFFALVVALLLSGAAEAQRRMLNGPLPFSYSDDVSGFALAPDGRIVYDGSFFPGREVHSVPLGGGTVVTLASEPSPTAVLDVALTPDGQRAVYRSNADLATTLELFAVPVDGSAPPLKLHPPLAADEDVLSFRLSADGARAVYLVRGREDGGGETTFPLRLYSVRVDGAEPPVLLSGELFPSTTYLETFLVTPDAARVVFAATVTYGFFGPSLYTVPIAGGSAPLRLSPPLGSNNMFLLEYRASPALLGFGAFLPRSGDRSLEVELRGQDSRPLPDTVIRARSIEGVPFVGASTPSGTILFEEVGSRVLVEVTCRNSKGGSLEVSLGSSAKVSLVLYVDPSTGEIVQATQSESPRAMTPLDANSLSPGGALSQRSDKASQVGNPGTPTGGPANDSCFDALEVFDGFTQYTSVGATTDGPAHPDNCERDGQIYNDIWFRYTASCEGTMAVRTCFLVTTFNTYLMVYPGDANSDGIRDDADCALILSGSVLPLACNADAEGCGFGWSAVEVAISTGEEYFIRLGASTPGRSGSGVFEITCAPPPANDECVNAMDVPCNTILEIDNTGATTNPTDPRFPCVIFTPPIPGAGSMWFRFIAEDRNVHITSSGLAALYDGSCGFLTPLACEDSGRICYVDLVPGNTYYVQVASRHAGLRGLIRTEISCPGQCATPPGDLCTDAPFIACNSLPALDNSGAHQEPFDPPFSCRVEGADQGVASIWRRFLATASSAKLSLNATTNPRDTLLAVYSGTCGNLTEIACSDDEGYFHLSELSVDGLTVGETYHVQIASWDRSEVGALRLTFHCPSPAPPNDACVGAISLDPLPASAEEELRFATTDSELCGIVLQNQRNVWYSVTGTGNVLTATTCHARTQAPDTQVNVFCQDCGAPVCVDGARAGFCPLGTIRIPRATVSWCSQVGARYLVTAGTTIDQPITDPTVNERLRMHLEVFDTGEPCEPEIACLPRGACCMSGGCSDLTAADCAAAGGLYRGDGTSCTEEQISDGDFELGRLAGEWTESSQLFDGVVCDVESCGFGAGRGARSGRYWAWFGGAFEYLETSIEQAAVIPPGTLALEFQLEMPVSSANGVDFLRVLLDGVPLFEVLEGDPVFSGGGYRPVSIPIGAFADGAGHLLRFESVVTGQNSLGGLGVTNFFVDDVSIRAPGEPCTFVLDFEREDDFATPLANGQALATPPEFGRLVALTSAGPNAGAAAFDSTPGGPNDPSQDTDLLVGRGNVLVLQNSQVPAQTVPGIFDRPNDDQDGGDLFFAFTRPVAPVSLVLVDIDQGNGQPSVVILTDQLGRRRTYTVPCRWTEDLNADGPPGWRTLDLMTLAPQPGFQATATATQQTGFDSGGVTRIQVHLGGSGAVDDLVVR